MKKTESIKIRVTKYEKDFISNYAKINYTNMSEIFRNLIKQLQDLEDDNEFK